jgi:peptide/nickel transport system ATP-binding protein
MSVPLLAVEGLTKRFRRGGRVFAAVDNVALSLDAGETLALVGASGSGKTTVSRLLLRLVEPDGGSIRFAGRDWLALRGKALRQARPLMQMVFQDPLAAFNPRTTVGKAVADPLRVHARAERPERVAELLGRVGLDPALAARAIHEISGGQRQRVAIARAIALEPQLLVLDEAVSALDVSVRARIIGLLQSLQQATGMAYLFVSHDLALVQAIAHRVAVMDAGRIVETGAARDVIGNPQAAMTRALVAAAPKLRKAT